MTTIKPGAKVPEFSLPMTGGGTWSLKDAAGKLYASATSSLSVMTP